jgi:hypothetical protein
VNKLAVLSRQVSLGETVTLRLTRGDDVTGAVVEIADTHVCLKLGSRSITIFDEIIVGWEVHEPTPPTTTVRHLAESPSVAANRATQGSESGAKTSESGTGKPSETVTDPAVLSRVSGIHASFAEAARRARLAEPEPDFTFYPEEFPAGKLANVRREWDRARNQYEYALKVREEARVINVVRQVLVPLKDQHPSSPSLRALIGCLLLKLGQRVEAVDHLRFAAVTSKKPEHWYALACSTSVSALECLALRDFLLTSSTDDVGEAWFRYVLLAIDHGDLSGLARVLERGFSRDRGSRLWNLAAETLVYILCETGEHELAQKSVTALLNGSSFPVEGWREILRRILPEPSFELVQEEQRLFAATPQAIRKPSLVPTGRITSFGSQRYGFIEAEDGETYFFRLEDVGDEGLRQALLDGSWRSSPKVEFTPIPSAGHKYQRAENVLPLQDATALLERARRLLQVSQHAQAMALVRRALAAEPGLSEAQRLEAEIKQKIREDMQRRGIGLPKGSGPYSQAKRAQFVDQDLSKAEQLFRLAIERGDHRESAVKDLASLFMQQRRFDEALRLLESERGTDRRVGPYDNMLATLYQQLGRHQEALVLLGRLNSKATPKTRGSILRRIAFSQVKLGKYDDAERTLRALLDQEPRDRIAERWLAGLEEARCRGSYDDAEQIIGSFGALAEEGLELSSLARAAIDSCAFEGVDLARLQSGTLTEKDVERLEDLAKQLGTRRPRDRAAYYLSAAAILSRRTEQVDAARVYDYLRRYFASMGDAAWADQKAADVVRSYYVESLALVSDEELDEAWRTLVRYLATFSHTGQGTWEDYLPRAPRRHAKIPIKDYTESLRAILNSMWPTFSEKLRLGLLDASSQSRFFSKAFINAITGDESLTSKVALLLDLEPDRSTGEISSKWAAQSREFARLRQGALEVCGTLTRHQLTVASMEDLLGQLGRVECPLPDLDGKRLLDLREIAESALAFCRATEFEEREQQYWLVTSRVEKFAAQVRSEPTQFSHAALLPVAEHLGSLIEEEYAEITRTSAAQLTLRLLVEAYPRLRDDVLRLQVQIANKTGCSPASSVRIVVEPEDSPYFESAKLRHDVISALRGGATKDAHVVLRLRDAARQTPAFPIVLRATYRNRAGEECSTEKVECTVRLYEESEFQEILNPYAPYAEGGPVDDPAMFVGREELLAKLEASLATTSASKCVVVFGQKRAGKSSLLAHLKRRLALSPGCLPVQFSLYEIGPALDEATFFYQILRGIADALVDWREHSSWNGQFVPPALEDMQRNATLRFHEAMGRLIRSFGGLDGTGRPRIVLLIDEFTEIYKQIRKGIIPAGFMRAWKAVVEKRYFATVLVGQDIMPAFKSCFPNEFGVTEDVRVTYLSEAEARRLIEEPIGANRYVGNAVGRILGLTAGSPYYTMMLCARLVDYMNRTRSAVVTEADIGTVEQEMLSGDWRLTKDKFDNLICAGDGIEDSGIDPEQTFRLCAAIAREGERGWCSRDSLRAFGRDDLEALLADLERRDVVERKGDAVRLRVGLFRDWLLANV